MRGRGGVDAAGVGRVLSTGVSMGLTLLIRLWYTFRIESNNKKKQDKQKAMASPASAKKQIVESIKDKTNILVTVSNNPSVDELAAALGLTIFLNKLGDKHATAVVSGQIPSAIDFLDPGKTFEASADSLRDFIISLDKEKADHLRYKVDGDVVKIFITPYRTTITSDDLEFSQGDYNVELVLAINVANSDELDTALTAHGRILHDATVATITAGGAKSGLGTIDWRDTEASSVSEMVAGIIQELKTAKAAVDEQIATSLLTGIVAATERFSNNLTSSRVMTVAAELMAAGANQQLIATKLQQPEEETTDTGESSDETSAERADGTVSLEEGSAAKLSVAKNKEAKTEEPKADSADGGMKISHAREGGLDDVARQVMEESQEDAARAAEAQLGKLVEAAPATPASAEVMPEVPPIAADIAEDLKKATEEAAISASIPATQPTVQADEMSTPTIGGTLNATTEQAAEDKRREIERDRNRTILSHGKPMAEQTPSYLETPMNAAMSQEQQEPSVTDIFATPPNQPMATPVVEPVSPEFTAPVVEPISSEPTLPPIASEPALEPIDNQPVAPVSAESTIDQLQQSAMADVNAALEAQPAPAPLANADLNAAIQMDSPQVTPTMADLEAQSSGLPPMPDFSSLPPLPPAPTGVDTSGLPQLPPAPLTEQPAPQPDFNPSQFQIPPQQ